MKKKRCLALALVAVAILLALLWLRPWSDSIRLPSGQSITMEVCDGQSVTWKLIYTSEDMKALRQAVSSAKTASLDGWTVPEDPWPVYGLTVNRSASDFVAVYCDGVWLDNEGRVLNMELDFGTLWKAYPGDEHKREGIGTLPFRKELAMLNGQWDPRFLVEHTGEPMQDVRMDLQPEKRSWTVTNEGDHSLGHGNGGGAGLEVCLEDRWYAVPWASSGTHYGVTAEGYELLPGESYSSSLWLEPYGDLPAGKYRLVFGFDWNNYTEFGYSAAEFFVLEDGSLAGKDATNG